jgi:hypothetical protein
LIAHHGASRHEAELRGLSTELGRFPREESDVAAALDFCDLSSGSRGEPTSFDTRVRDIAERHRHNPDVLTALSRGKAELQAHFDRASALLEPRSGVRHSVE